MKIKIMGKKWKIKFTDLPDTIDGQADESSRTIYIRKKDANDKIHRLDNFKNQQKQIIRHELVHAFLYESGLGVELVNEYKYGHDEQIIDWFARIYPRYKKVCDELKI